MSKVRVNNTVVISYISQAAKPKGGFRIYYRPETTGTTVTSASPSVPVGYGGRMDECVDNLTTHTLTVKLGGLLPLIEIPSGDANRILYVAFAPVDGSGNIGDVSSTVELTLTAPVWTETFTYA